MKLLVCGGAGFIGSNFVRQRIARARRRGRRARQAHLRRAARRTSPTSRDSAGFALRARRRSRTPTPSREAIEGGDAVVNFAAETHVDRSIAEPDAFVTTHALGTYVLLEAARERGLRYVQVSTDEVYGSIEEGSFTEESPLAPVLARTRPPRRAPTCSCGAYFHTYGLRGADLPRLQQLRALPVPREADPADGPQRPARRQAAGLRRRHAGAQLDLRGGLRARRSATCSSTASPARSTTSAARTRRRTSRSSSGSSSSPARDEALIEYVTDRPGHDRRYSLSSEKVRALGWEPQVRFADGLERHGRLVPRQRVVVGADPLGRLPRLLRAPVRARARLARLAPSARGASRRPRCTKRERRRGVLSSPGAPRPARSRSCR